MLEYAVNAFFVIAMPASLVLVVLGLLPDREPALYLTAVVLGLFWAAIALMFLVYEHRGLAAPDEGEQPTE